jgi:tRNA G18 (ribose-2'-O)-methylase SpoU
MSKECLRKSRGYFEVGIYQGKTPQNLGTLWRIAFQLNASGIFTIGKRYQQQASDTPKAWRHVPLRNYSNFNDFYCNIPYNCKLVGVEMGGKILSDFIHPERAIYLLGAEDHGLPQGIVDKCHHLVSLDAVNVNSYNVAVAGGIVLYNRVFGA